MRKVLNGIFVGLGFFFLAIGTVGIFLPILPTVKFYLLALICFAKGSTRLHAWFKGTKLYKKHLESFVQGRGMKLKTKIAIMVPVTLAIGFAIVRMDILPMRIMLAALLLGKHYYFWFRIKTLDAKASRRWGGTMSDKEKKMHILVAYSSRTGNTKMIAEAIYEKLSAEPCHQTEIFPVDDAPPADTYDLVFLGFWADKGTADPEAKKYFETLKNKPLALFFTAGISPDSQHAKDILANARALLDKSNCVLEQSFRCQGKIDPELLASRREASPERLARLEEASRHPDAADRKNAQDFAEAVLKAMAV